MATPQLPPKGHAVPSQNRESLTPKFQLPPVEIPKYLESIPIKSLKELASNHELLKDYILAKSHVPLDALQQNILERIERNIGLLAELETKLKDNIIPKQDDLIRKLQNLNEKFTQEWSKIELEMYSLLGKYSHQNLIKFMNSLVLEADELSSSIYNSLLVKETKLSDSEVSKFIQEYTDTRQLYHMRKEKYYRLIENRVLN